MTAVARPARRRESFDLPGLVAGAARLRPDAVAFADVAGNAHVSFADFFARALSIGEQLSALGLLPGERLIIAAGAAADALATLVGALHIGLDVAITPTDTTVAELAHAATRVGAAACVASFAFGSARPLAAIMEAAALCDSVRLVACLGPGATDGAVTIALDAMALSVAPTAPTAARVITFAREGEKRVPVLHRQGDLFADALEFVNTARPRPDLPLVSTLHPSSHAGLVVGLGLTFIAGLATHVVAPFDPASFARALERGTQVQVLAPTPLCRALAATGDARIAQLFALNHTYEQPTTWPAPDPVLTRIFAIGETSLHAIRPKPEAIR